MELPSLAPEDAREALRQLKKHAPEHYDFIMALYKEGMIDGARNLVYVKVNGREFGEDTGSGVVLHNAPRVKE